MSNFIQLPCGAEILIQSSMNNVDRQDLHPHHRCRKCGKAIPILGGQYDEKDDKHTCYRCSQYWTLNFYPYEKPELPSAKPEFPVAEPDIPLANDIRSISNDSSISTSTSTSSSKVVPPKEIEFEMKADDVSDVGFRDSVSKSEADSKVKRCKACGGTDHQRTSSFKCPFNKKRLKEAWNACIPTPAPARDPDPCAPATVPATATVCVPATATATDPVPTQSPKVIETPTINLKQNKVWDPNFINVANSPEKYQPVVDVTSSKFEAIDTVFAVKGKDHRGRAVTLDPSPSNLMEAYWPLTLIEEISVNSNCYIAERRRSNPDLVYWNKPSISRDITVSCIY